MSHLSYLTKQFMRHLKIIVYAFLEHLHPYIIQYHLSIHYYRFYRGQYIYKELLLIINTTINLFTCSINIFSMVNILVIPIFYIIHHICCKTKHIIFIFFENPFESTDRGTLNLEIHLSQSIGVY